MIDVVVVEKQEDTVIKSTSRWDWWQIPLDWVKSFGPGVPGIIARNDGTFEIHRSHVPMLRQFGYDVGDIDSTDVAALPPAPAGMPWRPWQERATRWANPRRGTVIVAEPRMGKSRQALALHDPGRGPLVILAPLDVRQVWLEAVESMFPGVEVLCLEGRTVDVDAIRNADAIFGHYDIVKHQQIVNMAPGTLIVDEAHLLSNDKSQRSAAVRDYAILAKRVLVLTGTPLWNSTKGLWPLLATANPGAWGKTSFAFKQRYCNPPEAPIWMGDLSFKSLGKIKVGDVVMGWEKPPGHAQSKLTKATVLRVMKHRAPIVKVTLASGAVIRCTPDHRWFSGRSPSGGHTVTPAVGRKLCRMVTQPKRCPSPLDAAYIAGILDGEGTWPKLAQCPVKNPGVHQRIRECLDRLGFRYYLQRDGVVIRGGRDAAVRIVNWCNPVKRGWIERESLGARCFSGGSNKQGRCTDNGPDEIVSVEPDGEGVVIGLSTTTKNYVAWGYASQNCSPVIDEYGWRYGEISNEEEWLARRNEVVFQASWKVEYPNLPQTKRILVDVPIDAAGYGELDIAVESLRDATLEDTTIGAITRYRKLTGKLKIDAVADALLQRREPVVAWCWHKVDVAKELAKAFRSRDRHRPVFLIHGDEPARKRTAILDAWRQEPEGILIATLAVGQVGIDLSHAKIAAFVEVDWTPAVLYQAMMRTFTPLRAMEIIFFRVEHPVEQLLVDKLATKLARGEASAMPAAGSGFDLSTDDDDPSELLSELERLVAGALSAR